MDGEKGEVSLGWAGGASQEDCGEPGNSGAAGKVGLEGHCVSFSVAAVTKHHKRSGLKHHRFIIF